ncbi:MAG: cytochrome c oxidase accessory protein CcoG, partial [Gammaproteobacteria bacterium]
PEKIPFTTITSESSSALYQSHEKVYPREVSGWFQNIRKLVINSVLVLFYGLAWLDWSDHQAVLFDLPARQFHIFEFTFWPQDFYLLTGLLIIAALTLFAATALAGRLWCGYACPQTVWTEMFLWIERVTEGHYKKRQKLDAGPWHFQKLWRKTLKQTLWITLALWTGITFVGYFTPIKELTSNLLNLNLGGWEWFWVLFYGFATYGNAGFLREQVCKYMCPYARFQSAMLDNDSLVISYDQQRGEPRKGSTPRAGTAANDDPPVPLNAGDCVNCEICVQVCPTGIDIRNGLQYECIGCAACIDACNTVMDKIGKPRGLIRYTSENLLNQAQSNSEPFDAVSERKALLKNIFRPRMLIYGFLWLGLITAFITIVATRSPTAMDIIRDRGTFYQTVVDGYTDNVYTLKIMNKTNTSQDYTLSVSSHENATLILQDHTIRVAPGSVLDIPVRVRLPRLANNEGGPEPIHFQLNCTTLGSITTADSIFWMPEVDAR